MNTPLYTNPMTLTDDELILAMGAFMSVVIASAANPVPERFFPGSYVMYELECDDHVRTVNIRNGDLLNEYQRRHALTLDSPLVG